MIPLPINEETSDKFPANDGAVTQSEKASEKTPEKTSEKTTEKILCIIKNSCTLITDSSPTDDREKSEGRNEMLNKNTASVDAYKNN